MFSKADFKKMYFYSLSLTKDEDQAYDLLQTALEKFYNSKGDKLEYPTSYLYRIIKNQFIDDHRKKTRWKLENIEDEKYNIQFSYNDQNNIFDELVSKEQTEIIFNSLKPDERELLYLWAIEGHTIQSIHEQTGTPKGTLLSKLHRTKKKLRDFLTNDSRKIGSKTFKTGTK